MFESNDVSDSLGRNVHLELCLSSLSFSLQIQNATKAITSNILQKKA